MFSTNDTMLLDAPAVRRPVLPNRDRTDQLARLVRHALKDGASSSPLDRAIRSAARATGPAGDVDLESRADFLARRLNALLAGRTTSRHADPHRETVTG
ncbi:MAG TPA: hypothetical protein VH120_00565 [Gemmataceae bacterium]|jgi:hypothetical protein|nr:hypothetical protein [Gemmataceae bacterium]